MNKTILMTTFSLLLMSCGNYQNIKGTPSPSAQEQPTAPDKLGDGSQVVDFETIKTEFLQKQCIECHTGRHTAYASYQVVKAAAPAMLARMQSSDFSRLMPQGGPPLPADKIALFKAWIEAGAPEKAEEQKPNPKPKPPEEIEEGVGFSQVLEGVLKPYNCVACHSQYNDYTTAYLDRGKIVSLVSSNAMPFPARQGGKADPVSDEGKKMLLDWVGQGAPEFADQAPQSNIVPEELKPNWLSLRNQVFGPKCILCHNDYGPRAGRRKAFNTYRNLRNWFTDDPNLFHFSPEEGESLGLFVESVERDPQGVLEIPMPFNNTFDDLQNHIEPITEQELEVIKTWIKNKLPQFEEEI